MSSLWKQKELIDICSNNIPILLEIDSLISFVQFLFRFFLKGKKKEPKS